MSKRKQKPKKKAGNENQARHLDPAEFSAIMKRIAIVLPLRRDN